MSVIEANTESITASDAKIGGVDIRAYTIPTDGPDGKEADGTLEWDSTTIVIVELHAGNCTGLGYTYADVAAAKLIQSKLVNQLMGRNPMLVPAIWHELNAQLRNSGRPGIGAMALSAVDVALWDLKARLLNLPLYQALGPFHESVPIYGSGGFCNYPLDRLINQVTHWTEQGIPRIKIKTSRFPDQDPERLSACRSAIGDKPVLMTDSNGALNRKEALYWAWRFRDDWDVAWMEEPVSYEDRTGLRQVRAQGPPGLEIAAGEYGYVLHDFADLLEDESVDCLQADVTRCGGITGLVQVAGLCSAYSVELSAHCAPAVSAHAFCAVEQLRHLEYFHDHVRIEHMLFEGTLSPEAGRLTPDPGRPGLGLKLKERDAERYCVFKTGST